MTKPMSHLDLEIYQLAHQLSVKVHFVSLKLPKFEMFEEGSQIRESAKSVSANIVEGYGRRRYKADYIKFLTWAHASCDETIEHLKILHETGSLNDDLLFNEFFNAYDQLGRKINRFIQSVVEEHLMLRRIS
jgi:four helix bundle protein